MQYAGMEIFGKTSTASIKHAGSRSFFSLKDSSMRLDRNLVPFCGVGTYGAAIPNGVFSLAPPWFADSNGLRLFAVTFVLTSGFRALSRDGSSLWHRNNHSLSYSAGQQYVPPSCVFSQRIVNCGVTFPVNSGLARLRLAPALPQGYLPPQSRPDAPTRNTSRLPLTSLLQSASCWAPEMCS